MTARFGGHDPKQGQDTAGVPWQGRTLTGTGFDADDGLADPELLAALGATPEATVCSAVEAASPHPHDPPQATTSGVPASPKDEVALLRAVSQARLIIPIVAMPGEDASSDMAAVTLSAPDGRKALPAFTSTEQLARWDVRARPVPVSAQRAALAGVQEGCDVIVLDVGTPHTRELRTSMVWALAMDREWLPAHDDPHVRQAVASAAQGEQAILRWSLDGGPDGALVIKVAMVPGLTPLQINEVLQRVGAQIATDGEARARIDAVKFRLLDDPASA